MYITDHVETLYKCWNISYTYVHVSYVESSISHDDDKESKDKELVRQGIYQQYE